MIHTSVGIPRCTAIRTCASGLSHCSAVPVFWFCCAAKAEGFLCDWCQKSTWRRVLCTFAKSKCDDFSAEMMISIYKSGKQNCYRIMNACDFITEKEKADSRIGKFVAAHLYFLHCGAKSVFQDQKLQPGDVSSQALLQTATLISLIPATTNIFKLLLPFPPLSAKKARCIYRRLSPLRQTLVTLSNIACHFVKPPFEAHSKKMASVTASS